MECQRHRVAVVVQQQVQHLRQSRRADVARAVDGRAVADLEQPLHRLGARRVRRSRSCRTRMLATNCMRSMRRPRRITRQPSSCIMSSSEKPVSAASDSSRRSRLRGCCRARPRPPASGAAGRRRHASSAPTAGCAPARRTRRDAGRPRSARSARVERSASNTSPSARDRAQVAADLPRMRPDARVAARRQRAQQQPRVVLAAHGVAARARTGSRPGATGCSRGAARLRASARTASGGVSVSSCGLSRQHPDVLGAAAALRRHDVGRGLVARRAPGRRASRAQPSGVATA